MAAGVRCVIALTFVIGCLMDPCAKADETVRVPILAYHRFGPSVADSMTVKTSVFRSQMEWLRTHEYTVIPLADLVDYLTGQGPPPPPKAVVITADDGHRSVYSEMLPIVRQYKLHVTLFIYPSAISNASYAMTWDQLKELRQTGLFDIQSHTYWHPNFLKEKSKLKPDAYQDLVDKQLRNSKSILEKKVGGPVDLLAWPFGLFDEPLQGEAAKAGYRAAFSIERRHARPSETIMALPRYLMVNGDGIANFEAIVTGKSVGRGPSSY
jgi:peptidoglycan/xylan/chitin deacetylase (PgdA/CDA1 family)